MTPRTESLWAGFWIGFFCRIRLLGVADMVTRAKSFNPRKIVLDNHARLTHFLFPSLASPTPFAPTK